MQAREVCASQGGVQAREMCKPGRCASQGDVQAKKVVQARECASQRVVLQEPEL